MRSAARGPKCAWAVRRDTGVSGRAANKVGEKLFSLSLQKQVLCVTHLPQIAALGQHQYLIAKQVEEGKTQTQVGLLDRQGRIAEIARMTADRKSVV